MMDDSWLAGEFRRVSLFSDAELRDIEYRVLQLRDSWVRRSEHGFFTLGLACYLDLAGAKDRKSSYYDRVEESNGILGDGFADVYLRLREVLDDSLKTRTVFESGLALPGFHVWLPNSIPRAKTASIHFDLQYLPIADPGGPPGPGDTVSFTVPVTLPTGGGGLNVWPLHWPEDSGKAAGALDMPCQRLEYKPGEVILHSGLWMHQIAETAAVAPDDIRLTLQGHGVRAGDRTILYW